MDVWRVLLRLWLNLGLLALVFHRTACRADNAAEVLAERLHGRALHAIDDVIRSLTGNDESVLGAHLRDESGQLLSLDFVPRLHRELAQISQCTDGSSSAQITSTLKGGASTTLTYNYAPIVSIDGSGISPTSIANTCVYLQVDLSALKVNTEDGSTASNKDLPIEGVKGASCRNCYASLGASLVMKMSCAISSQTCQLDMVISGQTAMNVDFEATNPEITTTVGPVQLFPINKAAPVPFLVFQDDKKLVHIYQAPKLDVTISANAKMTGTASFSAGFSGGILSTISAALGGTASSSSASIDFSGSLNPPSFKSNLQFTGDGSLAVTVTPTLQWIIVFGKILTTTVTAVGVALSVQVDTPIPFKWSFTQKAGSALTRDGARSLASPTCTSTSTIGSSATINGAWAEVDLLNCGIGKFGDVCATLRSPPYSLSDSGNFPYPATTSFALMKNVFPLATASASAQQGTYCLSGGGSGGPPTIGTAPDSGSGSGSGSASNNNGGVNIAAVGAIVVILLLVAGIVGYYVYTVHHGGKLPTWCPNCFASCISSLAGKGSKGMAAQDEQGEGVGVPVSSVQMGATLPLSDAASLGSADMYSFYGGGDGGGSGNGIDYSGSEQDQVVAKYRSSLEARQGALSAPPQLPPELPPQRPPSVGAIHAPVPPQMPPIGLSHSLLMPQRSQIPQAPGGDKRL